MTISAQWTATERLAVIRAKAYKQMELLRERFEPARFNDAYHLADEITMLAEAVPECLEANRKRLLEGME